jgi:hypothetical protein
LRDIREIPMQKQRPALLLPVLLGLPIMAAHADGFVADPLPPDYPIPANSLVIDYKGTIFDVSEAPEYAVGDSIAGRLLVDLSIPFDYDPGSSNSRTYSSSNPDFVKGFWIGGGDGFDELFIGNELARTGDDKLVDIFGVEDLWVSRNGSLDGARRFNLNATLYDFLDGVGLDQSFEVTSADVDEPHEGLSGRIMFSSLGPFPFVDFVLDRLSVKPGRCFAP